MGDLDVKAQRGPVELGAGLYVYLRLSFYLGLYVNWFVFVCMFVLLSVCLCNGVIIARTSEMLIWKSMSASGPNME